MNAKGQGWKYAFQVCTSTKFISSTGSNVKDLFSKYRPLVSVCQAFIYTDLSYWLIIMTLPAKLLQCKVPSKYCTFWACYTAGRVQVINFLDASAKQNSISSILFLKTRRTSSLYCVPLQFSQRRQHISQKLILIFQCRTNAIEKMCKSTSVRHKGNRPVFPRSQKALQDGNCENHGQKIMQHWYIQPFSLIIEALSDLSRKEEVLWGAKAFSLCPSL